MAAARTPKPPLATSCQSPSGRREFEHPRNCHDRRRSGAAEGFIKGAVAFIERRYRTLGAAHRGGVLVRHSLREGSRSEKVLPDQTYIKSLLYEALENESRRLLID